MKVLKTVNSLREIIKQAKSHNQIIGFVPTMGALHQGHLSLVKMSKNQSDITIVSIFVNPTQFNNPNDLKNYPRNTETDLNLLSTLLDENDIVFIPDVEEMYPKNNNRVFDFGNLETVMEGKHRKGHFNGVATIVSKFFDIVEPDKSFFGEKDFQQVAIIKNLVVQYQYPVEIIACPTIRENDGLAMSSRNLLLSNSERNKVNLISEILQKSKLKKNKLSVKELKNWVVKNINQIQSLEVEYFEIADDIHLQSIENWSQDTGKVGCIAVHVGNIRLIDNIRY